MVADSGKRSYHDIIKSSTIVAGSQGLSILVAVIRTKILAILLGPAGVGLMGLYSSAVTTINALTSIGIGNSGVRHIAEVVANGDDRQISASITTLRRAAVILGVVGTILAIIFREPISQLTFGNGDHTRSVVILSGVLFFGTVSLGQTALIQGMRSIGDLAKLSVFGAILGTAAGIPIILIWRNQGIAFFLLAVSGISALVSWWYARKIRVTKVALGWRDTREEAYKLLSFGVVFMASSLMSTGVLYLTRVLVVRQIGMEASGLYQAATTLSALYISLILNAMGMDFYPRLSTAAHDDALSNRLVNEQAEVGLLLAAPGILATLTFAPLLIHLFYSADFLSAFQILRWQVLGVYLRVISWPLAYILLARGKGRLFFFTELSSNVVYVALIWLSLITFGLEGTGIAFFLLNLFALAMIYSIVRHLCGFKWSRASLRLCLLITPVVGAIFLLPFFVNRALSMTIGSVLILAMAAYSLRALHGMVGAPTLAAITERIKQKLMWRGA